MNEDELIWLGQRGWIVNTSPWTWQGVARQFVAETSGRPRGCQGMEPGKGPGLNEGK